MSAAELPNGWQRRGRSIGEHITSQHGTSDARTRVRVIVDPVSSYAGNFATGGMFQAALNGVAFVVTKLAITSEDRESVAKSVKGGGMYFKVDVLRYPTYPLLYQRLFVPLGLAV